MEVPMKQSSGVPFDADIHPDFELADADPATGQNTEHSLEGQERLTHASRYNQWLVESVREAWAGAQRILDFGCSIGNVTHALADRLQADGGSPATVVGVEIIPEAAQRFSSRFGDRSDLRVICGDILDPPNELLDLAPFDAAVSFNVLEHIEDDVAALRRIAVLVKPGGRIGLLVPGGGRRLYGTFDALDRHFRRYTSLRLRSVLQSAGLEVLSVRRINMVGAVLWYTKGRLIRSKRVSLGETRLFDRLVPMIRVIDRMAGPPFGQSLAAVARVPDGPGSSARSQP